MYRFDLVIWGEKGLSVQANLLGNLNLSLSTWVIWSPRWQKPLALFYSPLWGCVQDQVGMVVKCTVGLFWGTHSQHGGTFVPQKQSHNALWQPSRPCSLRRNLKVANQTVDFPRTLQQGEDHHNQWCFLKNFSEIQEENAKKIKIYWVFSILI